MEGTRPGQGGTPAVDGRQGGGGFRGFLNGTNETAIGLLIVAVTVFGAYVAWRATIASSEATDLDQRARQERLLGRQIRAEIQRHVAHEQGLFDRFTQHLELAEALEDDAAATARRNPGLAREWLDQASEQRTLARTLLPMFAVSFPLDPSTLRPSFDREAWIAANEARNGELTDLAPRRLEEQADAARDRRLWLVSIGTGALLATFFLTLTLLQQRPSRLIARSGIAVAVLAFATWIGFKFGVEVPLA